MIISIMSAKLYNIRKYNDSTEFSALVEIYNQMARYLDPGEIEYTEEHASLYFSNMSDLSNYTLVFENKISKFNSNQNYLHKSSF